jgi:SAM-dependent methyltransferase
MADESSGALPTRLSAERADAHRRYNEALTALDRAIQSLPEWPAPPPLYDEQLITPINNAWKILPDEQPKASFIPSPVARILWDTLGPVLQQQMAFNAALVDHLNRNAKAHREAHEALARTLPAVREGFEALVRFESLLVQFLQQVTPVMDTKERALADAIDELRNVTAVAQRTAAMVKRELEQRQDHPAELTGGGKPEGLPPPTTHVSDSFKYVGFEDRFRGSEDEIRKRLADFVPYFEGAANVLDIGCGRGEFLDLLKAKGVPARGLDLNPEMVEVCLARGLDATTGDALTYLGGLPDESLGGLLAVQVIEHLEPDYLQRFLQTAFYKLKPGARMVLETINPACWVAFFESYIRDLSHVRPIHPETLQYLLHASGFVSVDVVYRAPIAEEARLQRVKPRPEHFGDQQVDPLTELVSAFNRNMDRLNSRMFTFQDYAAIATRS